MKNFLLIFLSVSLLMACGDEASKGGEKPAEEPAKKVQEINPNYQKKELTRDAPPVKTVEPAFYSPFPQGKEVVSLAGIFLTYMNKGVVEKENVAKELSAYNQPELDFLKSFVNNTCTQSENLLTDKFLKRPDNETLKNIYALRHVTWNSMSVTGVSEAVLDTFDFNTVSEADLLTAYYRIIFESLTRNRTNIVDYSKYNIDINKLGLKNDQEKAIVFHTGAHAFANKYNYYMYSVQNDCAKGKQILKSFPSYRNGQWINAEPPATRDFKFTYSNNMKDASFTDIFTQRVAKAKQQIEDCK